MLVLRLSDAPRISLLGARICFGRPNAAYKQNVSHLNVWKGAGTEVLLFNLTLRALASVCLWDEYGDDHRWAAKGFYASGLSSVRQPHVARAYLS